MQIKIKKRYHKTPSKVAKNNADHTSVNKFHSSESTKKGNEDTTPHRHIYSCSYCYSKLPKLARTQMSIKW